MVETRRLTQLSEEMAGTSRWPDPPFVIALSGGADSAALAALARDRAETRAIHVHHGWEGSDALEAAARSIAKRLSIGLDVVRVDVPAGPSPEDQARDARYEALGAASTETDSVLVGHTMDDQAETIILNLIRGAGTSGLAGMPYFRPPNVYRPLLGVTRDQTRELAVLRRLPFADDPTNLDLAVRRNAVRRKLIPIMQELNPGSIESMARAAKHLEEDAAYLDDLGNHAAPAVVGDGHIEIPVGSLAALPQVLAERVIRARIGQLRNGDGATTAETGRILEVVFGQTSGAEITGGIRASRQGPFLHLESGTGPQPPTVGK